MTFDEFAEVLDGPDKLHIEIRDENGNFETCFIGHLGLLEIKAVKDRVKLTGKEKVLRFKMEMDVYHKRYKELHLEPPVAPELSPDLSLQDLNITFIHKIILERKQATDEGKTESTEERGEKDS